MKRSVVAAVLAVLLAVPAYADVTITATTSGKGLGMAAGGETTTYIKGLKMRTDIVVGGDTMSNIIDVDGQQMIVFSAKKREAEVYNLSKLAAEIQKGVAADPKVSVVSNGQTRQILGRACDGYDVSVSVPMAMGDQQMALLLGGPIWIAKGAPGAADYAAFYKAAADKGFLFSNPQQARGAPAQAKSMAEMYRAMAATGGVPYGTDIQIRFEGSGMMAGMMNKMGSMSLSTTVTGVTTDPIGDDKFSAPPGYSMKNR